jgi:uncharacterized membrane-anchored protein
VIAPLGDEEPFAANALAAAPEDWVSGLPGEVMVAAEVAMLPPGLGPKDPETIAADWFGGNPLVGATLSGGAATAFTDFMIQPNGFSRFLIQDRTTRPRQAGRLVQRLLEIDTYRIMALLTLPIARRLVPLLSENERELAEITEAMIQIRDEDEPMLLDRLTRLQAAIESGGADNQFRFGAAAAYYDLVQRRIADLREERIEGLPTFQEFIERRLAPAMNTCAAVRARQEDLSQHMARATQLLSTRVNIANGRQSQGILESMNRRARLQMRLQETVEGLSIAAITYYIVGPGGLSRQGPEGRRRRAPAGTGDRAQHPAGAGGGGARRAQDPKDGGQGRRLRRVPVSRPRRGARSRPGSQRHRPRGSAPRPVPALPHGRDGRGPGAARGGHGAECGADGGCPPARSSGPAPR